MSDLFANFTRLKLKIDMVKVLMLFCLLLPFQAVQAQGFSGEIVYKLSYIPKNDSIDVEKLIDEQLGTSSSYLITDSYYKSTYYKNNKPTYSYTYHGDTKRMYDDYADGAYITYRLQF